uniref:GEO10192p1 n=1 Tax=Drosophila melanogaster TaxID=7227 RepID=Q9W4L6_DROME|eukprot:NP_652514.1 uncharacterized protein Dmel_CG15578 [Drosophila melanogaster]
MADIFTTLPKRRLVPNLLKSIIMVLEHTSRPMTDTELNIFLGSQYQRNDPEFFAQVQINLHDGIESAILRRQGNQISLLAWILTKPMNL